MNHKIQGNTEKYQSDTKKLLEKVLNHDDSVNERFKGSRLNQAQDLIEKRWAYHYGENKEFMRNLTKSKSTTINQDPTAYLNYWRAGGMYRLVFE